MKTIIIEYQSFILFILSAVALFVAGFTALIKFHVVKMKSLLIRVELYTVALLISAAFTYICNGMSGTTGFFGGNIANACGLLLNCLILYCYNQYLTISFMGKGRFKKLPDRLKLVYMISIVWMLFLCVSVFTGWVYRIDSDNLYQRGPLFWAAGLMPLIIIVIQLSFVIQYRDMVNRKLAAFLISANIFLIATYILQLFLPEIGIVQIAVFCVSASLFGFTLIEQNEELQKAAYTEMQSGLPNVYGYIHEIDKIILQGNITNYNAYYFDIAEMQNINNKYGKEKTDEIIKSYVKYISNWMKKNEVFGRLGGNYFVALVERERTEEFLKIIGDTPVTITLNGKDLTIHISAIAGCYRIDETVKAADQILAKISTAVAYAKNIAKESYVFIDDELERKINEEKDILDNIQEAFRKEEFEPFYQPKVETENYRLCGSEALVRWRRNGKLIPPFAFIPIMEKKGIVCSLDFYMLEHVCRDIRSWIDKGLTPPCVSVNFSRKNLSNQNLADDIYNILKKYDIPSNLIQIEVTETNDGYPLSDLKKAVDALHAYGISVAIDDFGTGSSSISLLKEVTFDVLKIDRTFVDCKEDKEKKLLSYIIEMSKAINISVIAEGVEDREQVQMLKDMDCTRIQGYVFDKPLERVEYEDRIRKNNYS